MLEAALKGRGDLTSKENEQLGEMGGRDGMRGMDVPPFKGTERRPGPRGLYEHD